VGHEGGKLITDEFSWGSEASVHQLPGKKALRVTLRFSHTVICTGCTEEQAVIHGRIVPSPLIHARSATIAIDPRTHRMASFSLGRR